MQIAFYSSRNGKRIARHGINMKLSDAKPVAFTLANRGRATELDVLERGRSGSGEPYWLRRYDFASGNCLTSHLLLEQGHESVSAVRMATRSVSRGWDASIVTCSRTLAEDQSLRVLSRHDESGSEREYMIKVPEEMGGVTGVDCCFLAGNVGDDYQGIAIALTSSARGRVAVLNFANGAAHWLPVSFSTDGVSILTVAAECISDERGESIALIVGEPGSETCAGAVHVYELRAAR